MKYLSEKQKKTYKKSFLGILSNFQQLYCGHTPPTLKGPNSQGPRQEIRGSEQSGSNDKKWKKKFKI